jgi:uncharacterized repeat protein (TIGR03803 family)
MLIAALGLVFVDQVSAQTFRLLHTFDNNDGATPYAGLTISGNTLYGTTRNGGGSGGSGTVFALSTDGTGFRMLHTFFSLDPVAEISTNADGAHPGVVPLALSRDTLYGARTTGGPFGGGTLFAVNTDGTGFTNLYSFPPPASGFAVSALIISDAGLFGASSLGGSSGNGMLFRLNTDGTGLTSQYEVSDMAGYNNGFAINSDGISPTSLILSGNTLYGTTQAGGSGGSGTVFALNVDGTGFKVLYSFSAPVGVTGDATNLDGAGAWSLIQSSSTLYGTAYYGGEAGNGTVFALNTDGTGFTNLYSFTPAEYSGGFLTNNDGDSPNGVLLSGKTLYGTAFWGGKGGGTAFAVNTDGSDFTTLHSFTGLTGGSNNDGNSLTGGLALSGNILFGTASLGGSFGSGTLFSISLPVNQPRLTITAGGENVILSWPTNATGFTLQSTTNLGSSAVWTTNSLAPVVVNWLNTVTNPISGTQQFYRLAQ